MTTRLMKTTSVLTRSPSYKTNMETTLTTKMATIMLFSQVIAHPLTTLISNITIGGQGIVRQLLILLPQQQQPLLQQHQHLLQLPHLVPLPHLHHLLLPLFKTYYSTTEIIEITKPMKTTLVLTRSTSGKPNTVTILTTKMATITLFSQVIAHLPITLTSNIMIGGQGIVQQPLILPLLLLQLPQQLPQLLHLVPLPHLHLLLLQLSTSTLDAANLKSLIAKTQNLLLERCMEVMTFVCQALAASTKLESTSLTLYWLTSVAAVMIRFQLAKMRNQLFARCGVTKPTTPA